MQAEEHAVSEGYNPNPEDERVVDLADENDPPPASVTLDADEPAEEAQEDFPPLDDDRDEAGEVLDFSADPRWRRC